MNARAEGECVHPSLPTSGQLSSRTRIAYCFVVQVQRKYNERVWEGGETVKGGEGGPGGEASGGGVCGERSPPQ